MLIPEGITPDNKSSMRVGFLRGRKISEKFGYEIGYYHDFNSMPLFKVFDPKWNITGKEWKTSTRLDSSYDGRYNDYDPMYPGEGFGSPSEYSRATGLSIQVFYYLYFLSKLQCREDHLKNLRDFLRLIMLFLKKVNIY